MQHADCCRCTCGYNARRKRPSKFCVASTGVCCCSHFLPDLLNLCRLFLLTLFSHICFKALHRCLFPGSATFNTFRSCTNPHSFELDNVRQDIQFQPSFYYLSIISCSCVLFRFLGTSGQNIDDLAKYSDAENKLEFLERTLRWRHLAPTTPNTLGQGCFLLYLPYFVNFGCYLYNFPRICDI